VCPGAIKKLAASSVCHCLFELATTQAVDVHSCWQDGTSGAGIVFAACSALGPFALSPINMKPANHMPDDGKPVHVLLAVSPVKVAKGRVIGASVIALDITRRKFEEDERLALIQDLTAALAHTGEVSVQTSGKH
jgi:hypothetical protein